MSKGPGMVQRALVQFFEGADQSKAFTVADLARHIYSDRAVPKKHRVAILRAWRGVESRLTPWVLWKYDRPTPYAAVIFYLSNWDGFCAAQMILKTCGCRSSHSNKWLEEWKSRHLEEWRVRFDWENAPEPKDPLPKELW
jgi:hypothetical protein